MTLTFDPLTSKLVCELLATWVTFLSKLGFISHFFLEIDRKEQTCNSIYASLVIKKIKIYRQSRTGLIFVFRSFAFSLFGSV